VRSTCTCTLTCSQAGQLGGGVSLCLRGPHEMGWESWGGGDFRERVGRLLWGEKVRSIGELLHSVHASLRTHLTFSTKSKFFLCFFGSFCRLLCVHSRARLLLLLEHIDIGRLMPHHSGGMCCWGVSRPTPDGQPLTILTMNSNHAGTKLRQLPRAFYLLVSHFDNLTCDIGLH